MPLDKLINRLVALKETFGGDVLCFTKDSIDNDYREAYPIQRINQLPDQSPAQKYIVL